MHCSNRACVHNAHFARHNACTGPIRAAPATVKLGRKGLDDAGYSPERKRQAVHSF